MSGVRNYGSKCCCEKGERGAPGCPGKDGLPGAPGAPGKDGDSRIKCCKSVVKDGKELLVMVLECDNGELRTIAFPCVEDCDITVVICDD